MKRLSAFSVVVLTILLLTRLHATTDEIRVVHGTAFQRLVGGGALSVRGTSGLSIDATWLTNGSIFWDICDVLPCLPDQVIDIGITYGIVDVRSGDVTIQGKTYPLFETLQQLNFDGTVVLPEFTDTDTDIVEVTAPFTFSGSLRVPSRQQSGTFEVFELQGSGVATVTLSRNTFFTGWIVDGVTYEFETPLHVTQP